MATRPSKRQRSTDPTEAPARRAPKPSKLKRFIRIALLMLIIIVASVGATLYYTWPASAPLFSRFLAIDSPQTDEAAAETPAPAPAPVAERTESTKPIFVKLDPFTVTLSEGTNRSRILYVAISLRVQNQPSHDLINEYMPVVRDRVLRILSEQHPQYLQSPEGREQLVETLLHALNQAYDGPDTRSDISQVLFTAFVIQ